jgi:hypothetical protein
MAVGSRAKKEARNSDWGRKRRVPGNEIEELLELSDPDNLNSTNLLPNGVNLEAAEMPLSDPEFGSPSVPMIDPLEMSRDEDINLEEELLSRLDNEGIEEDRPFNSDISGSIPEKVLI